MASELKRGAVRIVSNYVRLAGLLTLGILFVPIFIGGVGKEAYGLIGLLGSSMGLADMCREIIRSSMNRELGAAYNSDDPEHFPNAYNSAMVISAALAALTATLFTALYFLLPLLEIPAHLIDAARWVIIAKGSYSTMIVLLGPQFNMYLVSERMVLFNLWTLLDRATDFAVAAVLFLLMGITDPSRGLVLFAFGSAGTAMLILFFAVGLIIVKDRRLIPNPSRISRREIRKIIGTAGWNGLVVAALNLHMRLGQLIMNLAFGLLGNAAFTLALRLTGYVRTAATGMTEGLDVASARISTGGQPNSLISFLHHATRLHALVALPAGFAVLILAEPLMRFWVGRVTADAETIGKAVLIAQVLAVGMTARAISDGWMRLLYGAGHVRRYAPLIILGGLLNPVLAILLLFLLPEGINLLAPALAYAIIFVALHVGSIPMIAARVLSLPLRSIYAPLVRPVIAVILSSPPLFAYRQFGWTQSFLALLAACACFGALYAALIWYFVLFRHDRQRLSNGIRRQLVKRHRAGSTQAMTAPPGK